MEKEIRRKLSAEERAHIKSVTDSYAIKVAGTIPTSDDKLVAQIHFECGYTRCAQQSAPLSLVVELVEAFGHLKLMAENTQDFIPGISKPSQFCDAQVLKNVIVEEATEALTKAQPFMPKTGEDV